VTVVATIVNGTASGNYTQNFTITVNAAFVAVTSITDVPTSATVGTPLTLTGTVNPSNATNRTITWSVQNAGTTGATISGNTLNTTSTGIVTVVATIVNGTASGNYTQDFTITVNAAFVAVTNITDVPASATAGTPLALTGTVNPSNATNRTIIWSVQNAGTTGATISGNTLNTTAAGTVTVVATIVNGTASGNYTQNFILTVSTGPIAPSITGPDSITLIEGYVTTPVGPYIVTGNPAPTVSVSSDIISLIWNNANRMLNISEGLPVGEYKIILIASNGIDPDAVHIIVVTVISDHNPSIIGPADMTLYEGNAATSVDFIVMGNPKPIVTVSSDIPGYSWNDTTRTLYIPGGIPVGVYTATLTARNGVMPDATFTFTLTVRTTPPAGSLSITGMTSMLLTVGYAPTFTSPYFITGNPPVYITVNSDSGAISWNEATQRLDIAAGLWAGSYSAVLTASNGVDQARLIFTLTVLTRNGHGDGYGTGGCNAGYGYALLALALVVPFILRNKKL
jgi:Synergist-CTERM protein sorting domain-containing protein